MMNSGKKHTFLSLEDYKFDRFKHGYAKITFRRVKIKINKMIKLLRYIKEPKILVHFNSY